MPSVSPIPPVILTLDLSVPPSKPQRTSNFNFGDSLGQMTNNTTKLSEAFTTKNTFDNQVAAWEKQVKSFLYQAFSKIRHRKRKFRENQVGHLLKRRNKPKSSHTTLDVAEEIDTVENKIVDKIELKYANLVKETIGDFAGDDGKPNGNGLWKRTKKIFPKNKVSVPIALEHKKGNLITGQDGIKKLALEAITERLRKRPMHPNLKTLEKAKTKLTNMRLKIASRRKSVSWNVNNMNKAIRSMKNNKCRDPAGLIN